MKISIIVPTWNRADKILKTIKSVQNQTYKDWELLICDDGSTDNTKNLILNLIKQDKRIRWVAGDHTGLPAAPRNHGIKNAKGNWLAFLDSDDIWLPEKLEKQIKSLEKHGLMAACSNAFRFLPSENKKLIYSSFDKKLISFNDLIKSNLVVTSSVIFHKSLIKKCIGFPEEIKQRGIEDYSFWLRIATMTDFIYSSEPLLVYTDDAKNSVRGLDNNNSFLQKEKILKNFLIWSIANKKLFFSIATIIYLIKNFYYNITYKPKIIIKKYFK